MHVHKDIMHEEAFLLSLPTHLRYLLYVFRTHAGRTSRVQRSQVLKQDGLRRRQSPGQKEIGEREIGEKERRREGENPSLTSKCRQSVKREPSL